MTLTLPRLPEQTILPRCQSWAEAELQERILLRAMTLFQPSKNPSDMDTGYHIEAVPEETGRKDRLFTIWKPGKDPNKPDYTPPSRYTYDAEAQTCSCPFFSGIDPAHWSDTFRVVREGRRIVVYDRDGKVIPPDKIAHGYCKHHWGALLYFAGESPPDRSPAVTVPDDRDFA